MLPQGKGTWWSRELRFTSLRVVHDVSRPGGGSGVFANSQVRGSEPQVGYWGSLMACHTRAQTAADMLLGVDDP